MLESHVSSPMRITTSPFKYLTVAVTLGGGCASPHRSPARRQPEAPLSQATVVSDSRQAPMAPDASNAHPIATAKASGLTTDTESAPAASSSPKWPFEQPGATKHSIACFKERCIAGRQSCAQVNGESWECVDSRTKTMGSRLDCDDASDCAAGLACCTTGATSEIWQVCTPRSGPRSHCAHEVCVRGDGAVCPKGLHCQDGECVSDLQVTCPGSDEGQCRFDSYCEWKSGATHCVTVPEPPEIEGSRAVFACTRPADCGRGRQCCTNSGSWWHMTACATNCDITNSTIVCDTVADCRRKLDLVKDYPIKDRLRVRLSCVPVKDEDAPPWLRTCELDIPE